MRMGSLSQGIFGMVSISYGKGFEMHTGIVVVFV